MHSSLVVYLLEPVIKLTIEVIDATKVDALPRSLKKMKEYDNTKWGNEIVKQHLIETIEKDEDFINHLASKIINHPAVKKCQEQWESTESFKVIKSVAKRDDLQFLASYLWLLRPVGYQQGFGMCLGYLLHETDSNEDESVEELISPNVIDNQNVLYNIEEAIEAFSNISKQVSNNLNNLSKIHLSLLSSIELNNSQEKNDSTNSNNFKLPSGFSLDTLEGVRVALKDSRPIFLIDGYNLTMLKWPNLSLEDQRTALIKTLSQLTWRKAQCSIFFDAKDDITSKSSVDPDLKNRLMINFVADESADDAIIRACFSKTNQYKVVVTNDKEIQNSIVTTGSSYVSANLFIRSILG